MRTEYLLRATSSDRSPGPQDQYRKSWLREGFSEEDFADGGSERLVEGLVAWGAEEQVLQRVREHLQAGADQVLVQVIAPDNASLRRDWRRLAPALLAA